MNKNKVRMRKIGLTLALSFLILAGHLPTEVGVLRAVTLIIPGIMAIYFLIRLYE